MSHPKTLTFHVGSGRCGSTLLQNLLNLPAMHEMLAALDMKSDLDIYTAIGQETENLFTAFEPKKWTAIRDLRFGPHLDADFDHLIVTQENIFGVGLHPGLGNVCEESCKLIQYLGRGFNIRIVIVLRRQDTFLESLYNYYVSRGDVRDFAKYLEEFPLDNLHWADVVDTYKAAFGDDNVTVIPFEKQICETNGHATFVQAFFAAVGVAVPANFGEQSKLINASLAPHVMEVQRIANTMMPPDEAKMLSDWFTQNIPKRPELKYEIMTAEQRASVLGFYQESNRRLCTVHMAPYNAAGYYEIDA